MAGFDDLLRAVKQAAGNFAHSNAGRSIGEESLKIGLQRVLPHLADYIENRIRDIWTWFRQNF